jgi:hypothetical protein
MLHLATYIMMPFMAGSAMAAPTGSSSTNVDVQNLPSGAENPTNAGNTQLITSLINAATQVERLKLLPNNSDHVYDFNKPPRDDAITTGDGGHTVKADRFDFPALIGTGVSMTVGFIGPCGFNTPHVSFLHCHIPLPRTDVSQTRPIPAPQKSTSSSREPWAPSTSPRTASP